MNNFTVANPYTKNIPSGGTLNKVQLTNPQNVQIAWPNQSGGNVLNNMKNLSNVFKGLFK